MPGVGTRLRPSLLLYLSAHLPLAYHKRVDVLQGTPS